ncbi:MAG: prolipoprotein diacylglyceryl transferase [Candidatus Woesearchaeota archaeon]
MFINNINPILLSLGPFEVRYYGLVYICGFILTYLFLRSAVTRGKLKIKYEDVDTYILYSVIALIIGARLFEVIFFEPSYYLLYPLEILKIWHGGLSFHGGLVGVILVTYWFTKKHKIHFYDISDIIVIPAALTLVFGRIANYINSELVGKITNPTATPWCVVFEKLDSYCRHPSQLYESAKNLVIFATVLTLRTKKNLKKGILSWTFVVMYGALRFITNFWRDDPLYYGLSTGQWFSLGMVIVGGVFLWFVFKDKKVKNTH